MQVWLLSIVCNYCNTISFVQRETLVTTGSKSFIIPFPTVFEVWKVFYAVQNNSSNDKIWNKNVEYISQQEFTNSSSKEFLIKLFVYWQMRYSNDAGFWDDFFVRIVDSTIEFNKNIDYVIWENEWLINLYSFKRKEQTSWDDIFNRTVWTIWNWYFIQEVWDMDFEWFSWSFPFLATDSKSIKYINLLKDKKQLQIKLVWNEVLEFETV